MLKIPPVPLETSLLMLIILTFNVLTVDKMDILHEIVLTQGETITIGIIIKLRKQPVLSIMLKLTNMKKNIMRKMMNIMKRNLKLKHMSQEEQNLILPNLSPRIKEPYAQNLARNRSY